MVGEPERPQSVTSEEEPRLSFLVRAERHLWRRMASGLLVLIPLLVTIIVLRFFVGYLDSFFHPIVGDTLSVPGIGLLLTLVLLYVVGSIVNGRRGRKVFNWQNIVISKIPVVKNIYGVANQAATALSRPTAHKFSRVVFIEWPRPGVKALGFVTGHIHADGEGHGGTVVIYIPTVPNPTSGMLAWVNEEDVTETNITVEDAMKAVFSGGIVLPDIPSMGSPASVVQMPYQLDRAEDESA